MEVTHRPRCNGLRYACICAKSLSKCDLLTPAMRIEAAKAAVGLQMVQNSVTKCNKVWKSVTI